MNKENVLAVANAIEGHTIPDLGFNMAALIEDGWPDRYDTNCKTCACIAGWALCLSRNLPARPYGAGVMTGAAEWLELNTEQRKLFVGPYDTTPSKAVRALRHLAETGEVNWQVAS